MGKHKAMANWSLLCNCAFKYLDKTPKTKSQTNSCTQVLTQLHYCPKLEASKMSFRRREHKQTT